MIVLVSILGAMPVHAGARSAADRSSLVITDAGTPEQRKVALRIAFRPGGADAAGVLVAMWNDLLTDTVCWRLPGGLWHAPPPPPHQNVRWSYRDPTLSAGPVLKVVTSNLPSFTLTATGKNPLQPLQFSLDEPSQQGITVQVFESNPFQTNPVRVRYVPTAAHPGTDKPGHFRAKLFEELDPYSPVPFPCSASGAFLD